MEDNAYIGELVAVPCDFVADSRLAQFASLFVVSGFSYRCDVTALARVLESLWTSLGFSCRVVYLATPVVLVGLVVFPPALFRNWIAVSAADSADAVGEF
jgi:hypothetical protein